MSPRLACLFLALLTAVCVAQKNDKTYGKSESQILKMGSEKWVDYYTSKAGDSTASTSAAEEIYGNAAKRRNDRLLEKQLDGDFKIKILRLRNILNVYGKAAVDLAYVRAGGGTMFNSMWTAVSGEVEDTLYPILTASGVKTKPMVVSQVTQRLDKLHKAIQDQMDDPSSKEYFKPKDALVAHAAMRHSFDQAVAIAKTMSRRDSDRLLLFFYDRAQP